MAQSGPCCDRELRSIVEPFIEERAHTVQLVDGHKGVPVGHRSPTSCPGMQVMTGQAPSIRNQCGSWHICACDNAICDLLRVRGLAVEEQLGVEFPGTPTVEDLSYLCSRDARISDAQ